jgi:phosphatidylinositol alpha 1,6-mannosyltransferase
VFDSFRPDVVHLAAPVLFGARVARVADRRGAPVVSIFQTDLAGFVLHYGAPEFVARQVWNGLRRVHAMTDLTLAPTPTSAAEIVDHGFEPVAVWGRGVDTRQFNPARRSPALRAGWLGDRPGGHLGSQSGDRLIVGFVGRLAAEKQIDRLAVITGRDDVQLVLIGDGPHRPTLERVLPDAIFTGQLHGDELGSAMASLDIFVHTGENETFCQTIQEAMAAGVAVVAPAAGGPKDLVEHGVTGLLYQPGDTDDLVANVEKLVVGPADRERISLAGLGSVAGRAWSVLGDELIGHYREAISNSGSRSGC